MACAQIAFHLAFLFNSICLITLFAYFMAMVWAWYGWVKLYDKIVEADSPGFITSIVIAARNEAINLPLLLNDLARQAYPAKLLEIIVVDDHSDEKISLLPTIVNYQGQNLQIVELSDNKHGKKQALAEGVSHSKGELLVFTDADCRVSEYWVNEHVKKYIKEDSGMTIGLVNYLPNKGLFQIFSRFDLISLVITGAGFSNLGRSTICSGANLAVKRDLYIKVVNQLKNKLLSGDDIFLLHAIKQLKSEKISVLKSRGSIVNTDSPKNMGEFVSQRLRWASKSKHYSDRDTIILTILVLIANLSLVVSFTGFLINQKIFVFVLLFVFKIIADGSILFAGLRYFGGLKYLVLLPLFELIYPFYILFVAIGSLFMKIFWKGRKV